MDPLNVLNPSDYSTSLKVSANGVSVCSPNPVVGSAGKSKSESKIDASGSVFFSSLVYWCTLVFRVEWCIRQPALVFLNYIFQHRYTAYNQSNHHTDPYLPSFKHINT